MNRDNPNYPPWHCFTLTLCYKCGEGYEADREHICKKKNSYPITKENPESEAAIRQTEATASNKEFSDAIITQPDAFVKYQMKGAKMENLNAEQIIKALEHCIKDDTCEQCPYSPSTCHMQEDALALIKQLTEDNEAQAETITNLIETIKTIQADIVRKMRELIKERCIKGGIYPIFVARTIDQIAKEMLEGIK